MLLSRYFVLGLVALQCVEIRAGGNSAASREGTSNKEVNEEKDVADERQYHKRHVSKKELSVSLATSTSFSRNVSNCNDYLYQQHGQNCSVAVIQYN